jgi:RNA polymerase sigma-70 factor (ECF subfamily)
MQPGPPSFGKPSPDMSPDTSNAVGLTTGSTFDPARLIHDHQAGVWRYLRSLGCEPALADDLTQETFLAVLQRPFHDLGAMAAAAYLRKIAFNLYVSHYRRSSKVATVENIEEIEEAWNRWGVEDNGEALLEALKACLQTLTERARQALEMRFRDQQSRESIAAVLAISEHGAKNLMQRAKQQLRICVESKLKHVA